jgi:chromosome segregation ATPase
MRGLPNKGEVDAEKHAALRRMQSEYSIFEQDKKKKTTYFGNLEMELRQLKREMDRLEMRLEEKHAEYESISRELGILDAEGKRLKRKMNLKDSALKDWFPLNFKSCFVNLPEW